MSTLPKFDENLKPLKISNLEKLIALYSQTSKLSDTHSFIDIATGEIIIIESESINDFYEWYELNDEEFTKLKNEDALDDDILAEFSIFKSILENKDLFLEVPKLSGNKSYQFMQDFIEFEDEPVRSRLKNLTQGNGAFSRFKDEIAKYEIWRDDWYKFERTKILEEIKEWLKSKGYILK